MKTFTQFLNEDFQSPGGRNFKVAISSKKTVTEAIFFYEAVRGKSLPLRKYMKSFMSGSASEVMQTSNYWRAGIFPNQSGFDVFVWKGGILHSDAFKSLESMQSEVYPKKRYLKAYNEMNLLSPGESLPKEWCLPISVMDGRLQTNLNTSTLMLIDKAVGIGETFGFSEKESEKLIKYCDIEF